MKERESRRNQIHTVIKEMKLRPKIDPHDYETKKGHIERFLKAGDKVKITIMFRGREQSRPELGLRLLAKLADDVGEIGFVEATPKQDGRNMIMVLAPLRRKPDSVRREPRAEFALEGVAEAEAVTEVVAEVVEELDAAAAK
jgi:translation initiation factor IF-3